MSVIGGELGRWEVSRTAEHCSEQPRAVGNFFSFFLSFFLVKVLTTRPLQTKKTPRQQGPPQAHGRSRPTEARASRLAAPKAACGPNGQHGRGDSAHSHCPVYERHTRGKQCAGARHTPTAQAARVRGRQASVDHPRSRRNRLDTRAPWPKGPWTQPAGRRPPTQRAAAPRSRVAARGAQEPGHAHPTGGCVVRRSQRSRPGLELC